MLKSVSDSLASKSILFITTLTISPVAPGGEGGWARLEHKGPLVTNQFPVFPTGHRKLLEKSGQDPELVCCVP